MTKNTKTVTMQNAAAATGNGTSIVVDDRAFLGMQVEGITSATITFEGTIDRSTWYAIQVMNVNDGSVATTTTADGLFVCSVAGLREVRARISTYATGTITVTGHVTTLAAGMSLADIDVAGSEVVTLGAGTATYGKLAANSGVDIGDVDVTSIAAGETHIGDVGGADIIITQTPTVTAGAYSANDAVGGLLTFTNAARVSGGGGVIKSVVFIDDAGQDVALELWLFDTTITAIADNAAWALTEAQLHTCVAVISTTDGTWRASGTPSVCDVDVSRGYTCTGTNLFGQIVTRGTPTFAATDDVTVRIQLLQN